MNLNSILIGSEDPKPLVEYYTKLFGDPAGSEGGYTWWQVGTGGFTVSEHSEVKGKNAHPGRVIWNIETDDVKGDFERLKAAGATVIQAPYAPGCGRRARGSRDVGRHVRRPGRQLLPARQPDVAGARLRPTARYRFRYRARSR